MAQPQKVVTMHYIENNSDLELDFSKESDDNPWKKNKENPEEYSEIQRLKKEIEYLRESGYIEGEFTAFNNVTDRIIHRVDKQGTLKELVAYEMLNLQAKEEAKRKYMVANTTADLGVFENSPNLYEAFQLDYETEEFRIDRLLRVGHITTVAAPAKAGKTVLQINRVKSYVDRVPLFGEFEVVTPPEGNIGVWNLELTPGQMISWYKKAGIQNTQKVFVINGRGADLYIQNDLVLERAIKWCKEFDIEILEIDPLQAAFLGGISSDEDAGTYIRALQRLQREAEVDIVLTTHMGHAASKDDDAKRSIGSARWEGFTDNAWIYERDHSTNLNSLFIKKGRQTEIDKFQLELNLDTFILTHKGEQKVNKEQEHWVALVQQLLDGELHPQKETKKINSSATKLIGWLQDWGALETVDIKQGSGQKKPFIRLNDFGLRILKPTHNDNGTLNYGNPTKLWFEDRLNNSLNG